MQPGSLSKRLRRFIAQSITSVEQTEVLLFLRKESDRGWSAEEISRELRSSPSSIANRLAALKHRHLIATSPDGWYRYDPAEKLDGVVDELQNEYETRRARVIEAIFARPVDAMRSFADAFRIEEGEDDR